MSPLDAAINRLPHDQRAAARRNPGAFFGPAAGHLFVPPGFRLTEGGMEADGSIAATSLATSNDRARAATRPGFVRGPLGNLLPAPGGLAASMLLRPGRAMEAKGLPQGPAAPVGDLYAGEAMADAWLSRRDEAMRQKVVDMAGVADPDQAAQRLIDRARSFRARPQTAEEFERWQAEYQAPAVENDSNDISRESIPDPRPGEGLLSDVPGVAGN